MLSDCYINWLYMRVLKLTLGKIIFLQIFLQFLFFNVKCSDSLLFSLDRCGSDGRIVRWHVWTRTVLPYAYVATRVQTVTLQVQVSLFFPSRRISLLFLSFLSWDFCLFLVLFLLFSHKFPAYFVLLCILSLFQVFCFIFCIIFIFF
jgi:hypothetical protein